MPLEEARGFAQVKRHWWLAHVPSALFHMNNVYWENLGFGARMANEKCCKLITNSGWSIMMMILTQKIILVEIPLE